jgi:Icc-related predicted phosphoesterase
MTVVFRHEMMRFDLAHGAALKRIWFLGDVHGEFRHVARAIERSEIQPTWLVFLGDIEIDKVPFREALSPIRSILPSIKVGYIHGNHDAETLQHWAMLHDGGDAIDLHGKVVSLDGVKVAGLGGNFMTRIWDPASSIPSFRNKLEATKLDRFRVGKRNQPQATFHAAIYPDDVAALSRLRADILVTHEAPSCHPHGFDLIDNIARSLQVVRTFHGHHHDDRSDEYAIFRQLLNFDARAVSLRGIKNGLGEIIIAAPTEL